MKLEKEIPTSGSIIIELFRNGPPRQYSDKYCAQTVSLKANNELKDDVDSSNAKGMTIISYNENDTSNSGSIKNLNNQEWHQFDLSSKGTFKIYKETHRDDRYIYLLADDAIFQIDLGNKNIMRNGKSIYTISSITE